MRSKNVAPPRTAMALFGPVQPIVAPSPPLSFTSATLASSSTTSGAPAPAPDGSASDATGAQAPPVHPPANLSIHARTMAASGSAAEENASLARSARICIQGQ